MKCSGVVGLMVMAAAGFICVSAAAQSVPAAKSNIAEPTQKSQLAEGYGRLPLSFEVNQGQTDSRVKFLSRTTGQTFFLTCSEAVLVLSKPLDQKPDVSDFTKPSTQRQARSAVLRMRLLGANPLADVAGLEPLPGTSNYFIGNDPARWRTNVPHYGKVSYSQIYPGIDLVYYGNQRQLEYDFVVAPGVDPTQIHLAIRGASKISIDADGNAVVRRKDRDVRLLRPHLYQEVRGEKIEIAGGYVVKGNELRFAIAPYDHSRTLVIDPTLVYSTYLGGSGGDSPTGIAVDTSGNAYVSGQTNSLNFPGAPGNGKFQNFVVKVNATGTAVLYSTYVSGSGTELATGIAVDSTGSAYVTGYTNSTDFPTLNPLQPTNAGGYDAFVARLDATGNLAYATYLGGAKDDKANAIALDSSGSIYLAGQTNSTNFPGVTSSSAQPSLVGNFSNAFVAKLNATGSSVSYSTYLGGSGGDYAKGIAVDSSENAYVVGTTASFNFPVTLNPLQSTFGGGSNDAFVSMLNPAGTALVYSTYLGGNDNDFGNAIAVDSAGNAYVTGYTASTNFPGVAAGSIQPSNLGIYNGFVATLNATGAALVYSTYLGGNSFDTGNAIAVDASGNAYVAGTTRSTNFVGVTSASLQPTNGGAADAFIAELNAGGTGLVFSTYLGGSGNDGGNGLSLDPSSNIYVTGDTASANFPVTSNPLQSTYGGNNDAFVAKLSAASTSAATTTNVAASRNPSVFGQQVSFTVTVSPSSPSSLTPSGSVTINDGSTTLGTVALTSGAAIFNTSTLALGSHSITASYSGDSNFAASASTPLTQFVNQGTTTASVSASPNPGIVGQPVTLTATITPVAPAIGTPTGTVTFLDGTTSLGTGALSAGQATLTTSLLAAGSHSITATYAGGSNFLGSSSSVVTLGMLLSTTTTLIASPNPANAGQPITLSAAVAGSSNGTPTGSVTFLDGTTTLGTGPLTAGTAILITSSLAVGAHSLTASYPGDSNFASNTSAALGLSVLLPPAVITDTETITVTDTASFPDVFDLEAVRVTDAVFVTPLINVAASVADYSAGSLGFGNVAAGQTGTQSLTVSDIGQAPLVLSSAAISQSSPAFAISQIACSNGAPSLPTTLPVGGACAFLISNAAPSGPTANAVLLFTDNAALSNVPSAPGGSSYTQSIALNGSGTSAPPPPPPPAVIPVSVNETVHVTDTTAFQDVVDAENISVTDQVSIQVLNATTTSISISGGAVYGTPVSATVLVSSSTATVTGYVTLSVDGGTTARMVLTSGSAIFNLGVLKTGSHALAANFLDQGNFTGSSAQTSFTVNQATPTITWATPAAITYGTALSNAQLNATASVPGALVYTPLVGTVLSGGSQTLSVTFSPTDSTDYTPATATVTLQVNKATPTITWTNPAPITYGTTLSSVQLNATASVPGTFTYSPATNAVLSVGSQTLSVTFTPTDTTDYRSASATVTLVVIQQATITTLTSSANPSNLGQTVTFSATVTGTSPSGTVQFNDGTTSLGPAVMLSGGGAQLITSSLALGNHSIMALYSGDANHAASTSTALLQAVASGGSALTVSPSSLAFNSQLLVTSPTQSVTVTNTGTSPIIVNPVGLSGSNSGEFNARSNCSVHRASLAVNASCTIDVTFSPTSSAAATANLLVFYNGGKRPGQIVSLTGTVPVISLSSHFLRFSFPWGPQTLTVTNTGSGPAEIRRIVIYEILPRTHIASPFAVSNSTCPTSPQLLLAGGSCTITITYSRPKQPQAYNAGLVLSSETSIPYALVDMWGN